ncbi:MAG TPA: AAA family ATPase [Bryobacteraceae bacterium]|nr:AAA family ATPase [Bryobacteraceae bacterium]
MARPERVLNESATVNGTWRALFVGPDARQTQELVPILADWPAVTPVCQLRHWPTHTHLAEAFREHRPNLCFLDLASDPEQACAVLAELLRMDPNLPVVALLTADDPALILRVLRQGATDFLVQPFTADQVEACLLKVDKRAPVNTAKKGRVWCVMPAKGGCGATTIASNLAWQWKRLGTERILLADLDPLAGTLSFLFKIKSNYSFIDVLHRAGDIDADLWKGMVTQHKGVDVLLSPEHIGAGYSSLSDALPIVEYARMHYDAVILDSAGVYGRWNLSQARLADELLLVTSNELPALQAAQRALMYLDNNNVSRTKLRVLINRYDRSVGLNREVIPTALHADVFHVIPDDYEAVERALMEGKVIAPGSPFGKSLANLAERLTGRDDTPRKASSVTGGLLSLWGRISG